MKVVVAALVSTLLLVLSACSDESSLRDDQARELRLLCEELHTQGREAPQTTTTYPDLGSYRIGVAKSQIRAVDVIGHCP
jgi:hypothetical protein